SDAARDASVDAPSGGDRKAVPHSGHTAQQNGWNCQPRAIRELEGTVMTTTRMSRRFGRTTVSVLLVLVLTPAFAADDSNDAWAALIGGGHVALIRHGNAPPGYGGDPP